MNIDQIQQLCNYILHPSLIDKNTTIQVYEEIFQLGCFLNVLKPNNFP